MGIGSLRLLRQHTPGELEGEGTKANQQNGPMFVQQLSKRSRFARCEHPFLGLSGWFVGCGGDSIPDVERRSVHPVAAEAIDTVLNLVENGSPDAMPRRMARV
jgi:hypothetical protein